MTTHNTQPVFSNQLTFEPLTKSNWSKFVQLFGDKGACGNCWCMYHRLNKSDFIEGKVNYGNKAPMENIVWKNKPAGLLGLMKNKQSPGVLLRPGKILLNLRTPVFTNELMIKPFGPFHASSYVKALGTMVFLLSF